MRLHRLAAVLPTACALLACATPLPSAEREAQMGAEAAAQVEREIGLVRDPALEGYVAALGQRMVGSLAAPAFAYRFHVADMPEPNAFALPGGHVYVSRGLLALANDEAELANVIGHEIGHVVARHGVRRQSRATGIGLLSVLGTVAAAAIGGQAAAQAVAQLGQVAGAGLIADYSRDQERDADRIGQDLAARSGFDPHGMPAFLRSLERDTSLRQDEPRLPSFLDSHPVTAERIATTAARARELPVVPRPPVAGDRAAFLARIEGILLGPDPAEGVFRQDRFLHPTLGFAFVLPTGWKQVNQREAVGAIAPQGEALVVLQMQGGAARPVDAAAAFARQNGLRLENGRPVRIGGYDAYRARALARTQQGDLGLDLSWIAHPAGMFRIVGAAPAARFTAYAATLQGTATSFRGLYAEERRSIRSRHLAVVRARSGETLRALSLRSGNVWSVEQTAVANALDPSAPLPAGLSVKIAVERPLGG
jgi:predicted Zn-dependent protease